MDKTTEKTIRKSLHIPEGELLTIWKLLGHSDCPLSDSEQGVVNCPMAFDTGKWSPSNPPAWMRERLREEVLAHCQQCQGKLALSSHETHVWSQIYEILAGGKK